MRRQLGITEQQRITDIIATEMDKIETAVDKVRTAREKIDKALFSGGVSPTKAVQNRIYEFELALIDFTDAFSRLFKEIAKHFPI